MNKKEKVRDRRLRTKYNITLSEYFKLYAAQDGKCAICGKAAIEFTSKTPLHVDHDHRTHLVRGLLCYACNQLLPSRIELKALLTKALQYLINPPAVKVIGQRFTPGKRKPCPTSTSTSAS